MMEFIMCLGVLIFAGGFFLWLIAAWVEMINKWTGNK